MLDQPAAAAEQFDGQRVEEGHRVELRLVGQPHPAVIGERHVGVVLPHHREPDRLTGLELGAR